MGDQWQTVQENLRPKSKSKGKGYNGGAESTSTQTQKNQKERHEKEKEKKGPHETAKEIPEVRINQEHEEE